MQRLIAILVIAIALTPNTNSNQAMGAELGLGNDTPKSNQEYSQSFDGSYSDEPVKVSEKKLSKKTEKIMTYMARIGVDGAGVRKVTSFVNDRVDDNKLRIAGGEYAGFKMQLTHEVAMPAMNKFELRLTNENMPHWDMTGSSKGLMVNYKYEW